MEGRDYQALLLCVLFLSMIAGPASCTTSEANGFCPTEYLLADGTVEYEGWFFWHTNYAMSPPSIEIFMNVSLIVSTLVTSVSVSTVQFVSTRSYTPEDIYQERDGVVYRPSSYGIKYLDSDFQETDTSDTEYTVTCQVDKVTGIVTLYDAPYGATYCMFTAYYTSPEVYPETPSASDNPVEKVGELNYFFLPGASHYTIGTSARENVTVTGSAEYGGFDTWVLQAASIPEEFDLWEDCTEIEKNSGLFIGLDFGFGRTGEFDFEYHLWATDFADIIVTPAAGLPLEALTIGIGVVGVVAALSVSVVLLRRKKARNPAWFYEGENAASALAKMCMTGMAGPCISCLRSL